MAIDKGRTINYLERELYGILASNTGNVWLIEANGEIRHTFTKSDDDGIGGERPPMMATHNGMIVDEKKNEVIGFLNSFGLDQYEAEHVLGLVNRQREIEFSKQFSQRTQQAQYSNDVDRIWRKEKYG